MNKTKNILTKVAIMCIALTLCAFHGDKQPRKYTDMSDVISLWEGKNYFKWGSSLSGEFHSQQIVMALATRLKFERKNMATWSGATKSMITMASPFLEAGDKQRISSSLNENAELFEKLCELNDNDQARLIALLDEIVDQQNKHGDWIYTAEAEPVLQAEYNLLKKVWNMPKLFKSKKNYLGGHFYGFDKAPSINLRYDKLLWNTRYLNNYQYAVGVFQRRCRDVGATTPAARRDVAKKIAAVMREGAQMLKQ